MDWNAWSHAEPEDELLALLESAPLDRSADAICGLLRKLAAPFLADMDITHRQLHDIAWRLSLIHI